MPKLIMTKGLPASGKTRWAKEQVLKSGGRIKRVNLDDLRGMVDAGKWSREREKNIQQLQYHIVTSFLVDGFDVIVDNTNLHQKHLQKCQNIVGNLIVGCMGKTDYTFEIKDFTNVSLQTCLERDRKRTVGQVGDKVIINMWKQYLKPKPPKIIKGLPYCIICDIDGTLANNNGRNPFDETKVLNDLPIYPVIGLVNSVTEMYDNTEIIIFSGRSDNCKDDTIKWLNQHINYDQLHMRKAGDNRADDVVKKEMYEQFVKDRYNVSFVIDDRIKVCRMWYELGLFVFNVNQGLVEF